LIPTPSSRNYEANHPPSFRNYEANHPPSFRNCEVNHPPSFRNCEVNHLPSFRNCEVNHLPSFRNCEVNHLPSFRNCEATSGIHNRDWIPDAASRIRDDGGEYVAALLQKLYSQVQNQSQQQSHVNHAPDAGHGACLTLEPVDFQRQDDAKHHDQRNDAGVQYRCCQLSQVY